MSERYIVIELLDPEWPVIVVDEEGKPLIFRTMAEAQAERDEVQNGIIVEI